MLSSAGRTPQARILLEGRVHMQLQLFPTRPKPPKRSPILDRAGADDRAAMIRALARLMAKAVRPETTGADDER
jgi:hypothetical protein